MAIELNLSSNPSLNEIVSSLAARVDKPFDTGLQRELKHIVNYKRSEAIYNWLKSDPSMRMYFLQSFNANLEKVPASECAEFPTNCYILRTECEVPSPLRDGLIKSPYQMFDYVGDVSGYNPYQWLMPEYIGFLQYRQYSKATAKWFYQNSRIYIIKTAEGTTLDLSVDPPTYMDPQPNYGAIKVRGVFEDVLTLDGCDICADADSTECVSDDSPYSIPRELLNSIITEILTIELRVGPLPNEVKMDKDDSNVDSIEQPQQSQQLRR